MVGSPLRLVFFGTPQFAVPSLDALASSRHAVCGVVTQPDRRRGRGQHVLYAPVKSYALEHGIQLQQPERLRDPDVEAALRGWRPDLGVVAAYGKLIPPSLLTVPPHGMINVHASLLPKYRGAAPVHRAVMNGDRETGVTIMRVAEKLDTGNMFAQARQPIDADETSDAVERDLAVRGAQLLVEVVDAIAAGSAREEPQDERLSSYAPRLARDEGIIDWNRPPVEIHNQVRGLFPWPHASTWRDGERVIILATRVIQGPTAIDAPPGTVVTVSSDALHVATGGGGQLAIRDVQPEGRRPMPIRDYLAGHPIAAGARFGGP
jgi:methionyl-tRNA formyltransferase